MLLDLRCLLLGKHGIQLPRRLLLVPLVHTRLEALADHHGRLVEVVMAVQLQVLDLLETLTNQLVFVQPLVGNSRLVMCVKVAEVLPPIHRAIRLRVAASERRAVHPRLHRRCEVSL